MFPFLFLLLFLGVHFEQIFRLYIVISNKSIIGNDLVVKSLNPSSKNFPALCTAGKGQRSQKVWSYLEKWPWSRCSVKLPEGDFHFAQNANQTKRVRVFAYYLSIIINTFLFSREAMAHDERLNLVSFTGSTKVRDVLFKKNYQT